MEPFNLFFCLLSMGRTSQQKRVNVSTTTIKNKINIFHSTDTSSLMQWHVGTDLTLALFTPKPVLLCKFNQHFIVSKKKKMLWIAYPTLTIE